jgi:5,6,7,8-tetrahydromethanopterin hydro-lyase
MTFKVGEGFAGLGVNAAHVNIVIGGRNGPVGTAWATAIATPREGHAPFMVVVKPNVPVQPPTLFVNKAMIDPANEKHGRLTWGAAQAGIAAGIQQAHRTQVLDAGAYKDQVIIAAVWVNANADDEEAVFENNRVATLAALSASKDDLPKLHEVLGAEPENPYFRS